MIVVKIEMWPGGNEHKAHEIGRALIANVSDLAETSNYVARVTTAGYEPLGVKPQNQVIKVNSHERAQSITALLAKVFARMRP